MTSPSGSPSIPACHSHPYRRIADSKLAHPLHQALLEEAAAAKPVEEDPSTIQGLKDEQRYRDGLTVAMDANRIDAVVFPTFAQLPVINGDRNTQIAAEPRPGGGPTALGSSLTFVASAMQIEGCARARSTAISAAPSSLAGSISGAGEVESSGLVRADRIIVRLRHGGSGARRTIPATSAFSATAVVGGFVDRTLVRVRARPSCADAMRVSALQFDGRMLRLVLRLARVQPLE
jgi:hypothetical protein